MRQGTEGDDRPTLPPRPNPGPEPWPEPEGGAAWWLAAGAAVPIVAIAAWWLRRRRVVDSDWEAEPASTMPEPANPTERLIALVDSAREALARQLGDPWRAMTTEEIAGALPAIEPSLRERTIALLQAADRAKFAGEAPPDDHLAGAESWLADLLVALSEAGARSSQIGR